jgi:hypothetical protein
MAERIKRGGQRIRGSDGKRTRTQGCCCIASCTELSAWLQTVEIELEILTGVSYPNACCSGVSPAIVSFLTTIGADVVHDLTSAVLPGCPGADGMKWQTRIRCNSAIAELEAQLYPPALTATWGTWFRTGVALSSFYDGASIIVPWISSVATAGYCEVSGSPSVKFTFYE